MEAFSLDAVNRHSVSQFESRRFSIAALARAKRGATFIQIARLESKGIIGRHTARTSQLFIVVAGTGWARGEGTRVKKIAAGEAVFWEAGESHEVGTTNGLIAIVIEGDTLDLVELSKS